MTCTPSYRNIGIFAAACCLAGAAMLPVSALAERTQNRHLDIATRVAKDGSFVETVPWAAINAAETLKRQIEESPLIVVAEVVTNESRLTTDRYGIVMDYEILVLEVLKGSLSKGSTLAVVVPGGHVEFEDGAFARWNLADAAWPEPEKRYVWFLERAHPDHVRGGAEKRELYAPSSGALGVWQLEGRSAIVRPMGELRSSLAIAIRTQRMMANAFIATIRESASRLPTLPDVAARRGGQRAALTELQSSATQALRGLWTEGPQGSKRPSLLDVPHDVVKEFHLGIHAGMSLPDSVEQQVEMSACRADAVVIGTLTASDSFLTDDAQYVMTEYKLRVAESLIGGIESGSTVAYVRPGGAVNIGGRVIRLATESFPELELEVRYTLFLRTLRAEANSFTVITGEDSNWVADAIEMGDLAVGRSPWSLKELQEGVEIGRLVGAIDSGACQ